jgi:hypothetical protein
MSTNTPDFYPFNICSNCNLTSLQHCNKTPKHPKHSVSYHPKRQTFIIKQQPPPYQIEYTMSWTIRVINIARRYTITTYTVVHWSDVPIW